MNLYEMESVAEEMIEMGKKFLDADKKKMAVNFLGDTVEEFWFDGGIIDPFFNDLQKKMGAQRFPIFMVEMIRWGAEKGLINISHCNPPEVGVDGKLKVLKYKANGLEDEYVSFEESYAIDVKFPDV